MNLQKELKKGEIPLKKLGVAIAEELMSNTPLQSEILNKINSGSISHNAVYDRIYGKNKKDRN